MNSKGYIYILTNPSFPQFVKIGYADDVDKRVAELNRSTAIPYSFRVYATYEVPSRLTDLKLHDVIEKLNPTLRTIERIEGKVRKREFFAMSPEDAYALLEAMAEIHGTKDKLILVEPTADERAQEKDADEIREIAKPFRFSMCNIQPGEQLEFWITANECSDILVTVVDDRHIQYEGKIMSLSSFASETLQSTHALAGHRYFKYKGEWLNEIRRRNGY